MSSQIAAVDQQVKVLPKPDLRQIFTLSTTDPTKYHQLGSVINSNGIGMAYLDGEFSIDINDALANDIDIKISIAAPFLPRAIVPKALWLPSVALDWAIEPSWFLFGAKVSGALYPSTMKTTPLLAGGSMETPHGIYRSSSRYKTVYLVLYGINAYGYNKLDFPNNKFWGSITLEPLA